MILDRISASWQTRDALLKFFVMGVVLILSAVLSSSGSERSQLILLAAAALFAFFIKPELGLVSLLIAALCVPFTLGTGTQTSLHLAVILIPILLVLWFANLLPQRRVRLVYAPTNLPIAAFVIVVTVSLITGNLTWNYFAEKANLQAQVGGWAVFVFSAGIFLLCGNQIEDLLWLKILTGIFLALGAVVVIGQVIPPIGILGEALVVAPAQGSLFWIWLIALAGGLGFFDRSLALPFRLALVTLALITFGVGWFLRVSWVSGWVPGLITLLTLLWLKSWRLGFFFTVVGIAGVFARDPDLLNRLVALKQYSIDTRYFAWQIILTDILPANPILGLGPANYYHYTPLYPILGWYVKFNSHNQYVDLVAQIGVVGLAIFIWLMAAITRLGWQLRTRAPLGFARGYVYACLAGLVGSLAAGMLGDWFLPFVYNVGFAGFRASLLGWLFLGGLVAVKHFVDQSSQAPLH